MILSIFLKDLLLPLILSIVFVPLFGRLAKTLGVLDKPDGFLKPHSKVTPYFGGLGIYAAMLPLLWRYSDFFVIVSLLLTLGLVDDIFNVSPKLRFVIEFILSFSAVNLLCSCSLLWKLIYTIGVVALINAVNMMDGMDGVCAGNIIVSAFFMFLFSSASMPKTLSLWIIGSVSGYLIYNFPPAKIFMGDAGSYLLGSLLSVLYLTLSKPVPSLNMLFFIYPLWIYLLDLFSGVVRRLRNNRNPFKGDRDHIYDKLGRRIGNPKLTALVTYVLNAIFSSLMFVHIVNPILAVSVLAIISSAVIKILNMFNYDQIQ